MQALIDLAKTRAQNELGISLQEEVIFVGYQDWSRIEIPD